MSTIIKDRHSDDVYIIEPNGTIKGPPNGFNGSAVGILDKNKIYDQYHNDISYTISPSGAMIDFFGFTSYRIKKDGIIKDCFNIRTLAYFEGPDLYNAISCATKKDAIKARFLGILCLIALLLLPVEYIVFWCCKGAYLLFKLICSLFKK